MSNEDRQALSRGDSAAADEVLRAAIGLDDDAADAYYARGRLLEVSGDYQAARQAYLAAKDRDGLRFRAPEEFNRVIRAAAKQHGATVVDVQQAFVDASPNGLVGNGLMLEHLHPNLDGYFILADSFYEAIKARQLIDPWQQPIPTAAARKDVPVTEMERLRGIYTVLKLKADWPFQTEATTPDIPEPRNVVESLAQRLYQRQIPWVTAMQQLYAHYQRSGDSSQALTVALVLADALPYLENPQSVAGRILLNRGRYPEALRYLERAVELGPDNGNNLLALGRAYLFGARRTDAERVLRRLLQLDPNHAMARRLLAQVE
jgi:tetratricopeptide (TPR) repeat protein